MSLKHRISLLFALIAVLVIGWSAPGEAQARRGVVTRGRTAVVVRGGYYPFYYADPFWYGYPWFGFGFGYPFYGYPYYPYQYPYGYGFAQPDASVRLEVKPDNAEVFVDGYYAGIVDDFDGVFQRLHVPAGEHEITLWLDGYRTVHQTVYLPVDNTFKLKYTMEKRQAGDIAEPRPTPKEPPPNAGPPPDNGAGQPVPGRRNPGVGRRPPVPLPPPPPNDRRAAEGTTYGTLAIRVQPGNAIVTIDGERWDSPEGGERLLVELAEGTHRVQIQHDGFESYSTQITIRRGETTPLNVSLRR